MSCEDCPYLKFCDFEQKLERGNADSWRHYYIDDTLYDVGRSHSLGETTETHERWLQETPDRELKESAQTFEEGKVQEIRALEKDISNVLKAGDKYQHKADEWALRAQRAKERCGGIGPKASRSLTISGLLLGARVLRCSALPFDFKYLATTPLHRQYVWEEES